MCWIHSKAVESLSRSTTARRKEKARRCNARSRLSSQVSRCKEEPSHAKPDGDCAGAASVALRLFVGHSLRELTTNRPFESLDDQQLDVALAAGDVDADLGAVAVQDEIERGVADREAVDAHFGQRFGQDGMVKNEPALGALDA
jgi:hypothetical protein